MAPNLSKRVRRRKSDKNRWFLLAVPAKTVFRTFTKPDRYPSWGARITSGFFFEAPSTSLLGPGKFCASEID